MCIQMHENDNYPKEAVTRDEKYLLFLILQRWLGNGRSNRSVIAYIVIGSIYQTPVIYFSNIQKKTRIFVQYQMAK